MTRTEILAGATAALYNGRLVHIAERWTVVLLTLVIGAIVGQLCARRDPFDAALPAVAVSLLVAGYTALDFMGDRIFTDPVTPMAAIGLAVILATQFTFAMERAARERNRSLLQRFVAPQFVEELLDDPEGKLGLGGRRADICIIFADIRNFTPFAEAHSPEQVVETVNEYMTAMTDALHAYGGVLDKYTGDGLMAFFLLSGDQREDLRRSIRASLAMRDAAANVARRLESQGREPLQVGLGVHCGPAVVGIVGNPVHQVNYTALGETVVIAARLQGLAEGGQVVVSEAVRERLGEGFATEAGEPVQVKGITAPVRPFFVSGENLPPAITAGPPVAPPSTEPTATRT